MAAGCLLLTVLDQEVLNPAGSTVYNSLLPWLLRGMLRVISC